MHVIIVAVCSENREKKIVRAGSTGVSKGVGGVQTPIEGSNASIKS